MPTRTASACTLRCAVAPISAKNSNAKCRYVTRPAIANERLKRNRAGQLVLQLNSAYCDGTTHIVMSPLQFMQRLPALAPDPLPLRARA